MPPRSSASKGKPLVPTTRSWVWDKEVFLSGPKSRINKRAGKENKGDPKQSEFYDGRPKEKLDPDDDQNFRFVIDKLIELEAPIDYICGYFELYKASEKKRRTRMIISNMLTSLARFYNPQAGDSGSQIYTRAIEAKWPTLKDWYADPANTNPRRLTLKEMQAPVTSEKKGVFSDEELSRVSVLLEKWRSCGPFDTDDQLATFILSSLGSSAEATGKKFRLAEHLLLTLVGYDLRRIPLHLESTPTSVDVATLITHLQNAVKSGLILTGSRFGKKEDAEDDDGIEMDVDTLGSIRCLATDSGARKALMLAFRKMSGDPDARFKDLRKRTLEVMNGGDRRVIGAYFKELSVLALKDATNNERRKYIEGIKVLVQDLEVGYRTVMDWDARSEVVLLKVVLEMGYSSPIDTAHAVRRYGLSASPSSFKHRIPLIMQQEGLPALQLLRRSCPNWWKAMRLGDDLDAVAQCIWRSKGEGRGGEGRAWDVDQMKYEGILEDLASEDEVLRTMLPKEDLDTPSKLANWAAEASRSYELLPQDLTPDDITRLFATQLAISDRHADVFQGLR